MHSTCARVRLDRSHAEFPLPGRVSDAGLVARNGRIHDRHAAAVIAWEVFRRDGLCGLAT
jgi:hypothetical protein